MALGVRETSAACEMGWNCKDSEIEADNGHLGVIVSWLTVGAD